nr:MAG TPA: hypothetical protein [Caudoviricetes sp.]
MKNNKKNSLGVDGVNLLEDKKRRRAARLAEEKNIEK